MPNAILRVGPYVNRVGNFFPLTFVDPSLETFTVPVNCNKVNWVNDDWQAKSFAQWSFSDPGVPVNVPPGTVYDNGTLTAFKVVGLKEASSYDDWGDPFNGDGPSLVLEFYYQAAQDTTITLSWSFDDNSTDPQEVSYQVDTIENGFSSQDSITPPQAPPFSYSGTFTVDLVATTFGRVRAEIYGPTFTDYINGNNWSLKFS